ncbi:MAG: amino acid adenylation domain-containing protein [Clostridia bacterium]
MDRSKYSLTFPQKNIWLADKFEEDAPINVIVGMINIEKDFDEKICNELINKLIEENDILRARVYLEKDVPYQFVSSYEYEKLEVVNLSEYSAKQINEYIEDSAFRPFFLIDNKLYEFKILNYGNKNGAILLRIHHIIADAWSGSKMATSLIENYQKCLAGIKLDYVQQPSYIEYIETEKKYKESEKYIKDEKFWQEYLKDIKDPICLKSSSNKISTNANRYSVELKKDINDKIFEFCKENRLSPYALFLSALSIYLYRVKDSNDFVIGTPVLNRANFKEKQMLGMFVSTLPMRIKIEEGTSFLSLAKDITSNNLNLFRHQKYPYQKTLEYVHKTSKIKTNLYKIALSYQNARVDVKDESRYNIKWKFNENLSDDLQIHIMDINNTGILNINYDYLVDVFEEKEIEFLHKRIMAIIQNVITNSSVSIEDVDIMEIEEKNHILNVINDTKLEYDNSKNIMELFEEQAKKTPEDIAIVFEKESMTYKELNNRANRLAYVLREEQKVKPNDIVSLILNRSFDMIVAIFGVLKSGAAYLPIDPSFPIERIEYMIENSKSKTVIVDEKYKDILINKDSRKINMDKFKLQEYSNDNEMRNLKRIVNGEDLAYIIYTSGTTGQPKGVMITHNNLLNLRYGAIEFEKLEECRVWGGFSTYSFDISILEIFIPLTLGGRIILANEEEQKIPSKISSLIIENKIEVLNMTPTRIGLFIEYDSKETLAPLKRVMLGGEVFPPLFYDILKNNSNALIYDGYGPTEITVWSSAKSITSIDDINIGVSLPNTTAYILDKKNRLLPLMCEGQLCIGGSGVAKGYYNNDETTNNKFIKFNGNRIYKTGDLARFNLNNELEYLGRLDSQIKLHGLRIEIEEIEKNIKDFKEITQSAVIVNTTGKLCAYYTANKKIKVSELKKHLNTKLPKYMIPNFYLQLDSFKITTLGKVNKKELPTISIVKNGVRKKPKTLIQKKIYMELIKLIGIDSIGINDNIFDMGLDSLNVINLVTKLGAIDIPITYGQIYDYPTIEELSNLIEKSEKKYVDNEIANYDYSYINEIIKCNCKKNIPQNLNVENINNILLTGVTGFLGIHILNEFLSKQKGKVYCLVRSKNNISSVERLKERLNFFFGDKHNKQINKRIIIIDKEITDFNIENVEDIKNINFYNNIAKNIDVVIHSAARVKHFGEKEHFEDINVKGTQNIANFCLKYKKKMLLISTLSVSGNMLEGGYIEQDGIKEKIYYRENNMYVKQKLNNIYANTKFISERYVFEQIAKGLNAKIIRIGNLTSRYSDGKFQINPDENAFANRIKAVVKIKTLPEELEDFYLEFSPIDYTANAILKLARLNDEFNVFHLFNHNHILILKFAQMIKEKLRNRYKIY